MQVKCSYCGGSYDNEKHSSCPSCGGELSNSVDDLNAKAKEREMQETYRRQQTQRDFERQQEELERQSQKVAKFLKIGCAIPIILVLAAVAFLIISIILK